MKKIFYLFALCALFMSSCDSEDDDKIGILKVNSDSYDLNEGFISDYGTDNDVTYRDYRLRFTDNSADPTVMLRFDIKSNSTKRLEEGTYYYSTSAEKGDIYWVHVKTDLEFDSKGEIVAGNVYDEWNSEIQGSVTISKENDNYKFVLDLEVNKDDKIYTIHAEFCDAITENF